ncbi:MAG: hypothetical protein M3R39_01080 [Actinomycetota bacterium]|nr:hypothetical protein [Actinomycetota bacterium]
MHRIFALLLVTATGLTLAGLAGGASPAAKLRVQPPVVAGGNPITVTGTGFKPGLKVTLHIGRANTDNTSRLGSVKASRKGGFRFVKTIARSTGAGTWVVLACQANCRTKATAQFRVAKVKPV